MIGMEQQLWTESIPRLYAAASLKRRGRDRARLPGRGGIPRLYAAASLKHVCTTPVHHARMRYSAALCRGLIEARMPEERGKRGWLYSAALCRGLIEARVHHACAPCAHEVFRGFMPRPH